MIIERRSHDKVAQIAPFKIALFDQADLPIPIPFFQLLFPNDCGIGSIEHFDMDQAINVISPCKRCNGAGSMLLDPARQVICHTDVQCSMSAAGEDVDVVAHRLAPTRRDHGSPPSRGRPSQPSAASSSSPPPSPSGPARICSAMRPAFWRIAASILAAMSGLLLRKLLAFSRPWPMRWES